MSMSFSISWLKKITKKYFFGLTALLLSSGIMAQSNPMAQTEGSMAETGKPAAHSGQRPINNLPNPYLTQRNFGSLPDFMKPPSSSEAVVSTSG